MKRTGLWTMAPIVAVLLALPMVGFAAPEAEETEGSALIEIIWSGPRTADAPEGNWMQRQIEEKFGVKIINHTVHINDRAARELMITSGVNLPDVGQFETNPMRLYRDGVSRSIPKEMVREHAPNFAQFLTDNPPMWDVKVAPDDPDAFYTITGYAGHGIGAGDFPYVRLDWLERVGMAPAAEDVIQLDRGGYEQYAGKAFAHKKGYTLDQLEEMMYTFRDADLDGNGKADTIAYYMVRNHRGSRPVSGMWYVDGENLQFSKIEDGVERIGVLSEGWRSYLRYMQKWYADKLINQELPAGQYSDMHPLMGAGMVGITADCFICWDETTRPPKNLWDRDPEAKVMVLPHWTGPDGFAGGPTDYPPFRYGWGWSVNKTVDDAKLAKALEIMDWLNWDGEGQVQSIFGVEGKHYTWGGEPYNSNIVITSEWKTGGGHPDGLGVYRYQNVPPKMAFYRWDPAWSEWTELTQPPGALSNRVFIPLRFDVLGEAVNYQLPKAVQQYATALSTIRDEFKWKAIGGVVNLEEDWDAYVTKFMNSGGEELLAAIQEGPLSLPPYPGVPYFHLVGLPESVRERVENGEFVYDW